jgi:fibronectin-binding autotransporter adhesin
MKTNNRLATWNDPIKKFGRGLALLTLFAFCITIQAADVFKADNASNLNLGASWTNGVPPTSSDVAVWDSTVTTANAVEIGGNTNWAGIRITNPGGAVTLGINAAGITAVASSATLTYSAAPANPLVNDDRAFFAGTTAPGGFTLGTLYFVVNATATTFQLSATSGGTAITATSTGTAVNVTGGSILTLGASGIDTSGGSQPLTLPGPVISGAAQNWNLVSGVTINGGLSGNNSVTNIGSGTLTIGGQGMTLSNLVMNSGTVSIGAGGVGIVALNGGTFNVNGAINEGINAMAGGGTEQNTGGNRTWSGILTGSGPLTVIASSTHTWSGNNTAYAGTLTLQGGGALRLSSVNSVSALAAYNFNGGTMNANAAGFFSLGSLSGSGTIGSTATGNFSIGLLGTDTTFSGVINGAGLIVKTGVGTLTLGGANTYTGFTIISNGVLQIGDGGSAGSLASPVVFLTNTTSSTLSFNRSDAALNFTNAIIGIGGVRQNGSGTVFLSGPAGGTGANNYSLGTILNSGILKFATGALGTGGIFFTNNATLQWAGGNTTDISSQTVTVGSGGGTLDVNGNTVTLANAIGNSGPGALTVKSTTANGVLILQAANTYSGDTFVNSGTLKANNASGSATGSGSVTVSLGAAIGGTGTVSGSVDVQGSLSPGHTGVGTLTVGSLTLESGSTNNFEFNTTPANDKVVVTTSGGFFVNGGVFNLYTEGGVAPWTTTSTYNLIQFSGTAPSLDSSWTTASPSNPHVANPQTGYQYAFSISGGFLRVTISPDSTVNSGTWGVNADGNWSVAGNWTAISGTMPPRLAGDVATFGTGTALRTVTLNANETNGAITMNNANSFVIADSGKTLTLNNSSSAATVSVNDGTANAIQTAVALASDTTLLVSAGKSLAISGVVSNSSASKALTVTGPGTLSLSGNNSYGPAASSGFGTTLSGGGTLQVGNNNALGAGDVSVPASGTVQAGANGLNVSNNFDVASGAIATVDDNGNNLTLSGVISDSGDLTKIGNGTLTLAGNNTYSGNTTLNAGVLTLTGNSSYSGNTTVNAGVLNISADANLGSSPSIILNGGVLRVGATFSLSGGHNIAIGLPSGTVGTNALIDVVSGQSFQIDGVIASAGNSGANNLIVNSISGDNGTVILNGANTFSGTTTISNGTLQVINQLALQNSTLNYNSGTLVFDGSLTTPTLTGLTGTNDLTLTNLSGAAVALTLGNNNASSAYGGNLNDAGFGGSLVKVGTGTLTLSNANYTGNTTVSRGSLNIVGGTNGSSTSTFAVQGNSGTAQTATATVSGGTLNASQVNIGTGANQFGAALTINGTANATFTTGVTIGAVGDTGGGLTINTSGNVSLGAAVPARDNGTGLVISNGTVTATSVDVQGAGGASVGNANFSMTGGSFTIGDTNSSGAFKIGDATAGTGHGGNMNMSGGTLTYLGTDGLLAANGGGTTPHGNVTIRGGIAKLTGVTLNAGNIAGATSTLTVTNGATLYLGSVGLVFGTGGTTSATFGTGTIGALADWSSVAPITLADTTTFKAADDSSVAHNITLSGVLSGNGGLTKTGNGTLVLSGANTYMNNTTVSAGTLELDLPSLFTNSTVSVASGATLNLNFATTNVVAGLVLNGVSKTAGVYNNGTDPTFLAGTGSIQVAPSINPNPPIMGFTVSGNVLTLSWPTNSGWTLQQQTNSLSIGLGTNWVDVPGSTSIISTNITIDPAKPTVFYRLKL